MQQVHYVSDYLLAQLLAAQLCLGYKKCRFQEKARFYYRPKRSFGQGNIFTPVCHSFCSRGGVPDQTRHPTPPHRKQQTPEYGQQSAGTHPTGMHSSLVMLFVFSFSRKAAISSENSFKAIPSHITILPYWTRRVQKCVPLKSYEIHKKNGKKTSWAKSHAVFLLRGISAQCELNTNSFTYNFFSHMFRGILPVTQQIKHLTAQFSTAMFWCSFVWCFTRV